ncbi:MAG: hypothetical protein QNJ81_08060 [Acidimicrobiia bacterium]|nr:hypothetical protein [Acidimicrobiia bacterium]
MTPDEVFAELRRIRAEQATLDPASDRFRTLERHRRDLSAAAQTASDRSRGRDALQAELDHLVARLERIEAEKIEIPSWQRQMTTGRRFAINDPTAHAAHINATLDENAELDRAAIEARIEQLRATLAE